MVYPRAFQYFSLHFVNGQVWYTSMHEHNRVYFIVLTNTGLSYFSFGAYCMILRYILTFDFLFVFRFFCLGVP